MYIHLVAIRYIHITHEQAFSREEPPLNTWLSGGY